MGKKIRKTIYIAAEDDALLRKFKVNLSKLVQREIDNEIARQFDAADLELRPEFVEKMQKAEKGKFTQYKNMKEFQKELRK